MPTFFQQTIQSGPDGSALCRQEVTRWVAPACLDVAVWSQPLSPPLAIRWLLATAGT